MDREKYAFFLLKYYRIFYMNYKGEGPSESSSTPVEEYYHGYFNGRYVDERNMIMAIVEDIGSLHCTGTQSPLFPLYLRGAHRE